MLDGLAARLGYGGGGEMSPDWLLPYVDHVADGVVLLRDRSLIAVLGVIAAAKADTIASFFGI